MIDIKHNIHTHDLNFACYRNHNSDKYNLPGKYAQVDPPDPMADAAHKNTIIVAKFMLDVLKRQGIDGKRSQYTSTVKCVKSINGDNCKEWRNACWIPSFNQIIYGQRLIDNELESYAKNLEIVAHEIFHGVTSKTARLRSLGMAGALNESYSDIFAVIIFNFDRPNISDWIWEIGRPFAEAKQPLRSIKNPSKYGQPEHMNDYLITTEDKGGIHTNCSIHNKAAYNLINAIDNEGNYLFEPRTIANLFYLTLTKRLKEKSTFQDSALQLLATATTIFRNDFKKRQNAIEAINKSFNEVGIIL